MKLGIVLVAVALVLFSLGSSQAASRCATGQAAGFAELRSQPAELVGTLDGPFTGEARYFSHRFNCTGKGAQVRRVSLGLYEIRFPGLSGRMAVVSAISDEGISAAVQPLADGLFRVSLRGPILGGDVAARRDVAFAIVVF